MSTLHPKKQEGRDAISDREAWSLFRIAAISEAVSWLLLLVGMLYKYVLTPHTDAVVAVGGSIHGIVFLAYFAAVLGLFRILRLTPWQVAMAAVVSVIPFGTLIFEQWLARRRDREALASYRQTVVRAIIRQGGSLLAIQAKDVGFWCLPGGAVLAGESLEAALERTVMGQLGVGPRGARLRQVFHYRHGTAERLEFFFELANPGDYEGRDWEAWARESRELDAIAAVAPDDGRELRPAFLGKPDAWAGNRVIIVEA